MVSGGRKREAERRAGDRRRPSGRVLVWHSSFAHAQSRALETVRSLALGQQLELCLPGAAGRELGEALQWETSFFYEIRESVAVFLSPAFVLDYVSSGSVCMIAKNVPVDGADAASAMLLPSGELMLLVSREMHDQLGLVGAKYGAASPIKAASASSKFGQRYIITIDLKAPAFAEKQASAEDKGPTFRERVVQILKTKLQPIEMFVCAYNERGATCTLIFGDDDSIERRRRELNGSLTTLQDIFLPRFDAFFAQFARSDTSAGADDKSDFRMDELRAGLSDAHDWLGLVACRLKSILQRDLPDQYVSTFTGQSDVFEYEPNAKVSAVRWRGLMGAEFCEGLLDRVRQQVKSKALPWAAISVWGFPDAFVSWKQQTRADRKSAKSTKKKDAEPKWVLREHGYLENGSNNYTILLLPNDEYFLLQTLGPHDATV